MSQENGGTHGEPRDPNEQVRPPASDPYQQPPAYPYQQPGGQSSDPYQQGAPPSYQSPPTPYTSGGQTPPDQSTSYQSPYGSSPYQSPQPSPYQSSPYGAGPYAAPPSPGTDGFSIAALVTGLLGMAIVPIVLGIIGINRVKRTGQSGKGLAIAGIVLGGIAVIGWTLVIILFATLFQSGVFEDIQNDPRFNDPQFDSSVQEYGDDPTLDALYDACGDGDDDACHNLFLQSPSGSEYEEFGSTCGGREVVCFGF